MFHLKLSPPSLHFNSITHHPISREQTNYLSDLVQKLVSNSSIRNLNEQGTSVLLEHSRPTEINNFNFSGDLFFYWENFTHSIKCFRVLRPKYLIQHKRRTTSFRHTSGRCPHFRYINTPTEVVLYTQERVCRILYHDA